MLAVKEEVECKILFLSNYCLVCLNSRQILEFGLPVFDYSGFLDQQAIVRCNLVI